MVASVQPPATSGSSAPVSIGFAASVPFTQNAAMPRQQVRSVIAFTANTSGVALGATVETSLVADGTNLPTFAGFKEWGGSAGYLNTAGTVNYMQFRFDGLDYTYSIVQVVNPVAAPVLTAAATASGQNTVTLTFSKSLNTGQVPSASAFSITNTGGAQTVSSVGVSGSQVTLTTSRTVAGGDTIALTYTPPLVNPISSSDGENAGAVSSYTVYNGTAPANTVAPALSTTTPSQGTSLSVGTGTWTGSPTGYTYQWYYADTSVAISAATASSYTPVVGDVGHTLRCTVTATNAAGSTSASSNTSSAVAAASSAYARYTTKNAATVETVNGSGYNYGPTTGGQSFGTVGFACGVTGTKLAAASTSGYHSATLGAVGGPGGAMWGFQVGTAAQDYPQIKYGVYSSGASGSWRVVVSGTPGAATATVAFAVNDIARVRKGSGNIVAEVSKDAGSTWTTIYTWTGVASEDLYAVGIACELQEIVLPQTLGFA